MGQEEFYATAAQVLPTLLVALAVETGLMLAREVGAIESTVQMRPPPDILSRVLHGRLNRVKGLRGYALFTAALFVLGELAALAALYFGPQQRISVGSASAEIGQLAAPVIGLAVLTATVLAVALPLSRLPKADDVLARLGDVEDVADGPSAQPQRRGHDN